MSLFASIKPVDFSALVRPAASTAEPAAAEPKPPADKAVITGTSRRRTAGLKRAAEVLDHLPAVGETLWILLRGLFDAMHLVLALLSKVPGQCQHLRIASLSFSLKNADELAGLLDCGGAKRLSVISSDFQRKHDSAIFAALAEVLGDRQQTLAVARSHCKIVLAEMDNGDRWVFHGSPNMRSSRNFEQASLTCEQSPDAPVHDFLASWFDEVVKDNAVHKADSPQAG